MPTDHQIEQAARHASTANGLDATGIRVLHHYSNAIYLLPAENAVARATLGPGAAARVRRTQAVTRWLVTACGFPATQPFPGADPVEVFPEIVVSFWTYYPPPVDPPPSTSAQLADLLHRLHRLEAPPLPLLAWMPLESLHETIDDPTLSTSLSNEERHWIRAKIGAIRDTLARLDWPLGTGLIHGDAWAGNLLPHAAAGPSGVILGDWDWVCEGPREVDLIPTWHAATRYGRGPSWIRQFVDRYGYDLAAWDGYPTLMEMRDMVQLTGPIRRATDSPKYLAALRQRLDGLRSGDTTAVWTAI